jgi:hypothetical protein
MLRRGGFLKESAAPGDNLVFVMKTPLRDGGFVRTDSVNVGDRIAVFDLVNPMEREHDEACVSAVDIAGDAGGVSDSVKLTLSDCGSDGGVAQLTRVYLPPKLVVTDAGYLSYDFLDGQSAAVGVVSPNGLTTADVYPLNLDALQQPFDEAFVDFQVVQQGSGVVPHLAREWYGDNPIIGAAGDDENVVAVRSLQVLNEFSRKWFAGFLPDFSEGRPGSTPIKMNYLHVATASDNPPLFGVSVSGAAWVQVYVGAIERAFADADIASTQSQSVLAHEIGHQFKVNRAQYDRTGGHDDRNMWCSGFNACGAPGAIADGGIRCVMQPSVPANVSVNHFCLEDLMLGDPDALDGTDGRKLYSIRGIEDPL